MGSHAFVLNPEQMYDEAEDHESDLIREIGFHEGWDMPLADWHSPALEDDEMPEFPHHTLCIHLGGPTLTRIWRDGSSRVYGHSQGAVLPAHTPPCRWRADAGSRFRHFYFRPSMLARIAEETHDVRIEGRLVNPAGDIFDPELNVLLGIYGERAINRAGPPTALEMDTHALLIGLHLIRHYGAEGNPRVRRELSAQPLQRWRLRRVCDYIEAHLGEALRLDDLAALAELSPFHFSRGFKAATGVGVHRYVQERRLELACNLLKASDLPIFDIAKACGFASQSHFTTVFRVRIGTTPARFRERERE